MSNERFFYIYTGNKAASLKLRYTFAQSLDMRSSEAQLFLSHVVGLDEEAIHKL